MKNSKSAVKKLTLNVQILRKLAATDLQHVIGGSEVSNTPSCLPDPGTRCHAV